MLRGRGRDLGGDTGFRRGRRRGRYFGRASARESPTLAAGSVILGKKGCRVSRCMCGPR